MAREEYVDASQHDPVFGKFVLGLSGIVGIAALLMGFWGMKMYPPIQCDPGNVCNVMSIEPFFVLPGLVLLTTSFVGLVRLRRGDARE